MRTLAVNQPYTMQRLADYFPPLSGWKVCAGRTTKLWVSTPLPNPSFGQQAAFDQAVWGALVEGRSFPCEHNCIR